MKKKKKKWFFELLSAESKRITKIRPTRTHDRSGRGAIVLPESVSRRVNTPCKRTPIAEEYDIVIITFVVRVAKRADRPTVCLRTGSVPSSSAAVRGGTRAKGDATHTHGLLCLVRRATGNVSSIPEIGVGRAEGEPACEGGCRGVGGIETESVAAASACVCATAGRGGGEGCASQTPVVGMDVCLDALTE